MKERIDKIIASQGRYSRSEVKKLIKQCAVQVNGCTVRSADEKADAQYDEIRIGGVKLDYRRHLFIMLHKPSGVVSATEDKSATTVIDLLPPELRRDGLFPAGRLDADTTGFVLITDDGETAHRLLAPKSHVEKIYRVTLAEPLKEDTAALFERGVALSDGSVCMSAGLQLLEDGEHPVAQVVLREGMYHQIKRMFAACGNRVTALKRVQIGTVRLDEALAPGECRLLTEEEIRQLCEPVK